MTPTLILSFVAAFVLSFFGTVVVRAVADRLGVVDRPALLRKVHKKPIPLLGGIAIFFAVSVCVGSILSRTNLLTGGEITHMHYLGFLLGGAVLMLGGYLDDKYSLPPKFSILAPVAAAVIAIGFGIEVEKLSNPFGGILYLTSLQSDLLVFFWLLAVMYTTKFLDGLDGLAAGVSSIGALMILLLSLTAAYYQPDVALLSAVSLGALLGFLLWNLHPALIFLGEGGSTFVGYLVGILAVISGGKLATALLVLGIPLMDVIWTIIRRLRAKGVKGVFEGDRKHLHHRLLDLGWSQRIIVLAYLSVATTFGVIALFLQSRQKLVALTVLVLLMILLATLLVKKEQAEETSLYR